MNLNLDGMENFGNEVQFVSRDNTHAKVVESYVTLHVAMGKKPDPTMVAGMADITTELICSKYRRLKLTELDDIVKKVINGDFGEVRNVSAMDFAKWISTFYSKVKVFDDGKTKDDKEERHEIYKRQKERREQVLLEGHYDKDFHDDPNDPLLFTYEEALKLNIIEPISKLEEFIDKN